jgi:hypothetical protein
MGNKNTALGNGFAGEVAVYLAELLPGVERRVLAGNLDKGDLSGLDVDWFTAEVKREKKLDIGGALYEAEVEARNAGTPWFVAICWRQRAPKANPKGGVRFAYACMPLWVFREVLAEMRRLRRRIADLEAVVSELRRPA